MLGPPLGENPAPVEMRVDDDPFTKSAREGSICSDAPICRSNFNVKEVPPRSNVKRQKCKKQVHYLLDDGPAGARSTNTAQRKRDRRPRKKKKKIKKGNNIITRENVRPKDSATEGRSKNMKCESEDEFLADLEEAFPSLTKETRDSTTEPRQRGKKNVANRQVRAGRWRARRRYNKESQSLKQLIRDTKSRLEPTEQQILDTMNEIFEKPHGKTKKGKVNATQGEIRTASQLVETRVREMLVDWTRGGHGHIDKTRPDGVVRVYLENFNSLSVEKRGGQYWKPGATDALRKKTGAEIMGGVELQANWPKIKSHNQYHELFGKGEERIPIAAHNFHSDVYNLYGGTAMSVFGSMSRNTTPGMDTTGLGRWSWMAIDSGFRKTRFITAYRPNDKKTLEQT